MGNTTNTLGGGMILLAQAFSPSSEGAYPVTIECAKNAIDAISIDKADLPNFPGVVITNTLDEPVPGTVAAGMHKAYSPSVEIDSVFGSLEVKRSATVTIGEEGLISSINVDVGFDVGPTRDTFNSIANMRYSDIGAELVVSGAQAKDAENSRLAESISTYSVKELDRLMRKCTPPELISSTTRPSPFRLG